MDYPSELRSFDMSELKSELNQKVSAHHTIDQEKTKISSMISELLTRSKYR